MSRNSTIAQTTRFLRQQGQSLIGMGISLTVLIPLGLGVALLGQYIHIKLQTQAAAREAAWAATDDPALSNSGIPDRKSVEKRLRQRIFSESTQPFTSDRNSPPSRFEEPLLTTFTGRPLSTPSDLTLTVYQQRSGPSYFDKLLNNFPNLSNSGHLPPNKQGLITAEVHIKSERLLAADGTPLNFLGDMAQRSLVFSARTVLLADAWNASGNGETPTGTAASGVYQNRTVRSTISPLVPSTWLGAGFSSLILKSASMLGDIPLINQILTPGLNQFEPGRTAPDVVPNDKLVAYHAH